MTSFFRKLGWLIRRRHKEDELQEELQFHIAEEADERQAQGFNEPEAQRAGRRDLGNIALVQEDTRASWGWTFLEQFIQDIRYAIRTMSANRLFTLLAVVSFALAIGANTAIYSFMDAVLFRALPVHDPGSLVLLNWQKRVPERRTDGSPPDVVHAMDGSIFNDDGIQNSGIFPYPAFELLRKYDAFSTLFAYAPARNLSITIQKHSEMTDGVYVSGDYFSGLQVSPIAGRPIIPDDDRTGAPSVGVISYAVAQSRFGNASEAVGQQFFVDNIPFTIVGVAPPEFFGVDPAWAPKVFLPMHANLVVPDGPFPTQPDTYLDNNYYWVEVMGRLRPGTSLAGAQAALVEPFHQWVATTATTDWERSDLPKLRLVEGAAGPDPLRRRYARPLYVLMILVGLILAIACANVANLLLARATARTREIALRLSLGAGRLRVIRQLLTESVVLASVGGILGIVVAMYGIRFLTALLSIDSAAVLPRAELNWNVLAVAAVLSVITGLLFGLAPAIGLIRANLVTGLRETRAGNRPARMRPSSLDLLVVSQVVLSLLMLVAGGLFVRTLSNLRSVDVGFNSRNLLLFEINARQAGYSGNEMISFYEDLKERFTAIPGVAGLSMSNRPIITAGFSLGVRVDGRPIQNRDTRMLLVGPRFFSTMQIPIVMGREIDERETPGSPMTAVVSELFARTAFDHENPIGQHVTVGRDQHEAEIVGVAKDARYGGLKRPLPAVVYVPYNQNSTFADRMTFELRTADNPLLHVNTIREIVRSVNPLVPVAKMTTQTAQIEETISQEIMFARVCIAFAVLALAIACVGLYGTVAYNVARRTSEIGIRMALGAQRVGVIRMILQKVLVLVLVALGIGLPVALKASTYVKSFLFAMKPTDAWTMGAAVLILVTASLLAAFIPARRASRIDPLVALRHE
jgi:macrolide transport system ATP-binding/permease protein